MQKLEQKNAFGAQATSDWALILKPWTGKAKGYFLFFFCPTNLRGKNTNEIFVPVYFNVKCEMSNTSVGIRIFETKLTYLQLKRKSILEQTRYDRLKVK